MLLAAQQPADLVGGLTVVLFYGVRVDVHGERRCAVAEPVLCGLDVRLVADGERRLGVTELVELHPPLVARPLDASIPIGRRSCAASVSAGCCGDCYACVGMDGSMDESD